MKEFYKYTDNSINFHYSRTDKYHVKGINMHTHLTHELYCFVSGRAVYKIEGTRYPLHPGDILIMRAAESHSVEIDPSEPYERFSLNFSPEIIHKIDPEEKLLRPFYDRPLGKQNLFSASDFSSPLASLLAEGLMEKTENPRIQIISMLIPLLNELCISFETKSQDSDGVSTNALGKRIIDYVNRHLSDDLSLDQICARYYISKPQLCRIFKASTGSTVWEYVTVKRLMMAQQMLSAGTPPTKAAIACGFNDYSVFYRAYRRKFGTSPKNSV